MTEVRSGMTRLASPPAACCNSALTVRFISQGCVEWGVREPSRAKTSRLRGRAEKKAHVTHHGLQQLDRLMIGSAVRIG